MEQSSPPAPIRRSPPRTRLRDHVLSTLAYQIVGGELHAGEVLPSEVELTEQFDVSKLVVRESIQALAAQGLVQVQQGKRTIVLPEREWDVLTPTIQAAFREAGRGPELATQFYEARSVIEVNSATMAAQRASEEEIAELDRMIAQMRDIASGSRDLRSFLAIDRQFHDAIGRVAGNTVLRQVNRAIHSYLSDNWSGSKVTHEELETLAEQHAKIADSISRGDSPGARRSMQEHLEWAEKVEQRR